MKLLLFLFLIPVLITPAFAEQYYRGEDFSVQENPDGSMTRTIGLPPWIYDGENFAPQIVNDYPTHIKVESATSSFIYDKDSCSISIYAPGRIGSPIYDEDNNITSYENNTPLVQSESWSTKEAKMGTDDWVPTSWTDDKCTTNLIQNSTGVFISGTHQNGDGLTTVTYAKPINQNMETFTEVKNTNLFKLDYKFGTDQVIILADNVEAVHDTENEVIKFNDEIYMDYKVSSSDLWVVNEKDDSIHLDYKSATEPLSFNEVKMVDPTWGTISGSTDFVQTPDSSGTSCGSGSVKTNNGGSSILLYKDASGSSGSCIVDNLRFDVSGLPIQVNVTNTVLGFTIGAAPTNAINCDYNPITVNPLTATAAQLYTDITDGTPYVDNDATCTTAGAKTLDLGTTADTNLATAIAANGNFNVGVAYDSMTRDASIHSINFQSPTLAITYSMLSPDPPKLVNATLTGPPYEVVINWSTPEGNGGGTPNAINIQRLSLSDVWEVLHHGTITTGTYTDSDPIQNLTANYRLLAYNAAIKPSEPQAAMTTTQTTGLRSHWPMISTTNDNGREDNDGAITGNEIYDTTGEYFDGSSYDVIPNESDYDFIDRTNAWTIIFNHATTFNGAGNQCIICKGNTVRSAGFFVFENVNEQMILSVSNTTNTNEVFFIFGGGAISDGVEHQYAITKASGTGAASEFTTYKDGVPISNTNSINNLTGNTQNAAALTFGAESDGGIKFTGSAGEIQLYNYQLSADEILQRYQGFTETTDPITTSGFVLTNNGTIGDTIRLDSNLDIDTGFPFPEVTTLTKVNGTTIDTDVQTVEPADTLTITNWYRMLDPSDSYLFYSNSTLTNDAETVTEDSNSATDTQEYDPSYLPALDNPSVQGNVNYTMTRTEDSDIVNLKVNREGGSLSSTWQIECIAQNNLQASQSKNSTNWEGTWSNTTNVGWFNTTWSGFTTSQAYITCFNDDRLFTGISYTNSSLALLGIQLFDESYGSMLGVPVGIFFIVITAGMANKRTAPTWIIVLAAIAGMMAVIGFFTLSPIVWGVALVAAMLGVFVNQKVF